MKLLPALNKKIRTTNVKKQLNFIYFITLLLPILIIGTTLLFSSRKLFLQHYQNLVEADNTRVKSIMFDITTTVYNISDELFNDESLQTFLKTRYTSSSQAYRSSMTYYDKLRKSYLTSNTFISSLELYTSNSTIYSYSSIRPVTDEIRKSDWYQLASNRADIIWKSLKTVDAWKHASQELCLLRRIPIISTGEYAILVIRISNIYLKNRIQYSTLFTTVTVNEDPIFFSSSRKLTGQPPDFPIDYKKKIFKYSDQLIYKGKSTVACISTLIPYISRDKIYVTTMDFEALPDLTRIIYIMTAIILLGSFLPYIIYYIFTNRFTARIITLRGEMHKASKGDYDIIDNFRGNDELSEVFSDLKLMIHSIKQMDSQMYEAKIQEQVLKNQQQKMEFKMLASQINPHFLYNTLETIRMKAFTEGNREVANAIKLLGKSMHYVLENNGTSYTTLKKELDYISTYLAIQRLRFNDRVNYTLHIPEDLNLDQYHILPLLLQPVVENAILHGLEGTEIGGRIIIDFEASEDDLLLIRISDNGMGMSPEEVAELNAQIQTAKRKSNMSIGLNNINQRIKLFYGEIYGMEIVSHPGEGTIVTLSLPLHKTLEE
jgi:Predicted signal transduction protein with a C-terminal ATPase domain